MKMLGIVVVNVVRESENFSGHPCILLYRAHCAVIFAIAQFSCIYRLRGTMSQCITSPKLTSQYLKS